MPASRASPPNRRRLQPLSPALGLGRARHLCPEEFPTQAIRGISFASLSRLWGAAREEHAPLPFSGMRPLLLGAPPRSMRDDSPEMCTGKGLVGCIRALRPVDSNPSGGYAAAWPLFVPVGRGRSFIAIRPRGVGLLSCRCDRLPRARMMLHWERRAQAGMQRENRPEEA